MRAMTRVLKTNTRRKYSLVKCVPAPLDEFDLDPPTKPIPPTTMAVLVAQAVAS